jgi:hypothetical protein
LRLFSIELLTQDPDSAAVRGRKRGKDHNCREVLALPYFLPEVCWDACQWLGHNPRA